MARAEFEHRGFMLDVCRHYMPVQDIKRLLRAAALCGMNRMHWHLTDDQGWRIEIRRYPRLTEVGAKRGRSTFGAVSETENNSGFYTQAEARDIVAYAKGQGIEIIPEVELPGHAAALLAAYPEYGCRRTVRRNGKESIVDAPYRYQVLTGPGIFPDLVCAGKDAALDFLKGVLDEIMEIFPFPMVHIGGDEALKIHWRRCPDCQRRMLEQSIESEDALQRWLMLQVGEYLAEHGRDTVVWNDVLAGGPLPGHFIVQQWMGDAPLTRAFMANGGRVICSDTDCWYFDYAYGTTDVRRIWEYPAVPTYAAERPENLLGVECTLWTERVTNPERAACMLFPRLTALGVKLSGQCHDWESFVEAVREKQAEVEALGLRGAPEAMWNMSPEAAAADRAAEYDCIHAPNALPIIHREIALLRLDRVERLMASLGIPSRFARQAGDCLLAEIEGEPKPETAEGAEALGRQLLAALTSREAGEWQRLPEPVCRATMACFPRFIGEYRRSYGVDGFDRAFWTVRQVEARLFRLGELEYELLRGDGGAHEIALHIPSNAKLEPDRLNASIDAARRFMSEYFPEWNTAPMTCESWLLSPVIRDLLPGDSRIRMFQRAFDVDVVDTVDDSAALEWVFKLAAGQQEGYTWEALPEDTRLQRGVKALMRAGGHVGSAKGVLRRTFEG